MCIRDSESGNGDGVCLNVEVVTFEIGVLVMRVVMVMVCV